MQKLESSPADNPMTRRRHWGIGGQHMASVLRRPMPRIIFIRHYVHMGIVVPPMERRKGLQALSKALAERANIPLRRMFFFIRLKLAFRTRLTLNMNDSFECLLANLSVESETRRSSVRTNALANRLGQSSFAATFECWILCKMYRTMQLQLPPSKFEAELVPYTPANSSHR